MDEESIEKLAFLDSLLKQNNEKIFLFYIGIPRILTNTYTTTLTTK